jgi:L,D-peptidoglycan transpeptidase YkuD (ErfK/YbiS/YcfS/YnhG family)
VDIVVDPAGELHWAGRTYHCALGRSGARAGKREGDGATPIGRFPLRRVFFRPDRLSKPTTAMPVAALSPDTGWCDDPADPQYNRLVRLPYGARHERLWRSDGLYDVIVVVGHNDDPVVPGLGSAIFLHVARPDYRPTEGCVAVALADLLAILAEVRPAAALIIQQPANQPPLER